jgi:hypothetical protein
MIHPKRSQLSLASLLLFLLVITSLLAPAPVFAAPDAPTDTPATVVTDNVEAWAVGAGLVYWASNCYADEFNPFADLKRKPVGGGVQRTLEAIDDYALCITYQNLLSTADGLYYFDNSQARIERMPLGEPYTPQVVKALTSDQAPIVGKAFIEAGDYLYWVHAFFPTYTIHRVKKDGSGEVETVANTSQSPSDVMVVGNTVYWTDSTGVWRIRNDCATLPCSDSQSQFAAFGANTSGYGLLYQFIGGVQGAYRVYWVQRVASGSNSDYQIRYRQCGQIAVCFLSPQDPTSLLYGSTTNWRIGSPILTNGNLYWTEADNNTVNNNNGDVKRRAYNAATPGADTIATGQAKIESQLYVANDLLFFARRNTGIYSLALNASAITRDFRVDGMEVTQGIQNLANQAPLVANKLTYVRAYATQIGGPSTPNVEARLVGTRGGAPLPGSPLRPLNGVRALTTGAGFDRARLSDGWYFVLPSTWLSAGAVTLKVEVDPRQIHTDPNRANNELAQTLTFQSQPPVCVWTAPVRTHTPLPSTRDPNFWTMVNQFNRRWPVPDTWIFRDTEPVEELEVCWWGPVPYPCYGPYELEDGWGLTNGIPDRDKVITSLWMRAQLSFNPDACDDIGAPVHFMGMVHPDANNGGAAGYASTVSNQSWVQLPEHAPNPAPPAWNSIREGSVMAQELAHNYGRKHVNCGGPDNVDGSYPYPPCQLANVGATSYYGFDTATLQPIRPDATADFMSYANRSWVSDYTWRALLNSFIAAGRSALGSLAPAAGDTVYIAGLVDMANNRGEIVQALVLPAASIPPATRQQAAVQAAAPQQGVPHHGAEPHAVFTLRLLDPVGSVLVERLLTLAPIDDHTDASNTALFSDIFTPPAGQVATLQLLADNSVIDVVSPGPASPTLSVQQPVTGALVDSALSIQWTASDPDAGDRLLFTVQYSHDAGASWHTLAVNLPSTPNPVNQLVLDDLGSLHGSSPNTALIRVLASDGYHTAIGVSQPFTLKNRPPAPVILAPGAGETVAAGAAVVLQGSATDAEDGGLIDAALRWQVDNAPAGSGSSVAVAGLAPGAHIGALAATDADGQTVTTTVSFAVTPLGIPLATTFALDGVCTDDGYATATALALPPYSTGAQANASVVRSDQALWVCFSGLAQGATVPGAFAGVRIDVNHSRDAVAQPDDYGFMVGEDGDVNTLAGDGAGSFTPSGVGGLQAQVSAGAGVWSAELRIDQALIGGWDHPVGLSLGHYWAGFQGDDYPWPATAVWNNPSTWGTTALGSQPVITTLDPFTATIGAPTFALTVTGSSFISGTVVVWNGAPLPTAMLDGATLVATVGPAQLSAAGLVQVKAQGPAPGNFASNSLTFVVATGTPAITGLSPSGAAAGGAAFMLTVNGGNFAPDAQVLWNGAPLATQFVSASQLRASVTAALLANGQTVGVAVRNQLPDQRISSATGFVIEPDAELRLYLPMIDR